MQTNPTQTLNTTEEQKRFNIATDRGLRWPRIFGTKHPYDEIFWEKRTAKITKGDGTVVFEQKDVETPNFWSQTATDIVASKYFRGRMDAPEREKSVRQMVDRVAKTVGGWGWKDGYFASEDDCNNFTLDLTWVLVNQYAAFNSPVWFNVGVHERPQCSACQPYHALISTPRGFFKIGEIVENNLIGLSVYDSHGLTKVVAVKNNGIKKVLKIKLKNGSFIEITGNHLVRAVFERRTKPSWFRADQLKEGMRLHLYPHRSISDSVTVSDQSYNFKFAVAEGYVNQSFHKQTSIKNYISSQIQISEAALAGWLQADGFVGKYNYGTNRSLTLEFLVINEDEKSWVLEHLNNVFPDIHKKIRVTKTKHGTEVTRIRLYGKSLEVFVNKYDLLKRRQQIRVPEILWKSGREAIIAYLRSVFQAEGFVSIRKGRDQSAHLAFDTISGKWMEDVQILLYGLGIYSRLRNKKDGRENREDLVELDISMGSERQKFSKLVGFIGKEKQFKLLESLALRDIKNVPDLREEEIVSIEDVGEQTVYDIQTQSGEYLTNNITVHNCFILAVEDNMQSILDWYRDEGWIFKYGSGAGTNLSKLRSSKEALSKGGFSSGPVSFMKGADGVANSIRSGGTTRRAAKMVILNAEHPDIKNFIYCKKIIEDMTKALQQAGIKDSITADIFDPYTLLPYQNANNSVRVSDEFMQAVLADKTWDLKAVTNGETIERLKAREVMDWIADAAWHSADPGMQYDTTINEWHTCSNTGPINASNPCSEYMSIDNSACNLASLNLLKFLSPDGNFNIELYKRVVDTMITSMDILIDNSSYPTPKITENAKNYRQLGLGYANLGALLMSLGLPYDSEKGRIFGGQVTALLCGQAYRMSALLADIKKPFDGYELNREPMLGVLAKHLEEAEKLNTTSRMFGFDDGELGDEALKVWQEALELGKKYGIRNSQATVLAPTGTIAFLMDCDTTGVEPELALVKYKKLVGGGMLKLINGQVPRALHYLGYGDEQISEISNYLLEKDTIEGAPHIKEEHLPVFDCSFKAQNGSRSIHYLGHLKMMAAAQPFISGAISKTVNLPEEATREDVQNVFIEGWRLGLKAIAIYRDGSKSLQPLSTKKEENNVLIEKVNGYTRIKLPDERPSITHKFSVGGFESYLTVGFYPDTMKPGETFITTAKEGSTISGLFDTIATLISMCLQSGIPLKTLVRKFKDMRFDPSGFTNNPQVPMAKSVVDYVFRYLGMKYLNPEDKEELFGPEYAAPLPEVEQAGIEQQSRNDKILAELVLGTREKGQVSRKDNVGTGTATNGKVTSINSGQAAAIIAHAPICTSCGTIMIRAGSCYSCPNCFATTGVCN